MNHQLGIAPCVSVLVPAYNEAATIGIVVRHVLSLPIVKEVIVVDDCSTDGTAEVMSEIDDPRLKLLKQPQNAGKTAAIQRALDEVSGDIVIIQDADLEYDPSEIPNVVDPILRGKADVVYGSRFLVRKAARVLYYYHALANHSLTTLSNLLTNLNLTDVETGYKAFRTEVIRGIPLVSRGFGMEIELTASVAKLGVRIYEVPISYYGRTYAEGKKIGFKDGLSALWYILYFNALEPFTERRKSYFDAARERLARGAERFPRIDTIRPGPRTRRDSVNPRLK
ncbi:MAG TPA: glycosyltransferase family 2 protein [Polyangiaceae bacterium]|nr:glycosyltransferase family 2 protein [Polyangiaceae bacterium]